MMVRKSAGLGERHLRILEVLAKFQNKGYPPSIRDICEETGITSTSVVNYYLEQLEKWGYIERDRKISRGVRIMPEKLDDVMRMLSTTARQTLDSMRELVKVPKLGRIVAGEPSPVPASDFNYFDAESTIDIARGLLPQKTADLFALEVDGDSMVDAMVSDGDIVVMRRMQNNSEARNGDMLAIWLPSRDETTLKYFYKERDGYRLQPANPTMDAIRIPKDEPLEIKGKVVMVIRRVDSVAA
ncbi:MAG TPA: transcriptional repressor LexA [Anaerolineales bacterium]|jgi:repressor LexA